MTEISLQITDYAHDGAGVGRYDNKVVFLDGGVIGDVVEVEIETENKRFCRGKIVDLLRPSHKRELPQCPYFHSCGGCTFLNVEEYYVNEWKEKRVEKALNKIGIDRKPEDLIKLNSLNYRNNVQLKVEEGKLGFYSKKTNSLVPIKECLIAREEINEVIKLLRETTLEGIGQVQIRCNFKGDTMVIVEGKVSPGIVSALYEKVSSLYEKHGRKFTHVFGEKYLEEEIEDLRFLLGPGSFFQVNYKVMNEMYFVGLTKLKIKEEDKILDLYSGIGTLTLLAARKAKEVTGVEYVEEATDLARKNAELNGMENATFICGKAEEVIEKLKGFNKVIVDPPRKGMDKKVVEKIIDMKPENILYISCNPDTFARDVQILTQEGYKVETVTPADMFPRGPHTECITLISKKDS